MGFLLTTWCLFVCLYCVVAKIQMLRPVFFFFFFCSFVFILLTSALVGWVRGRHGYRWTCVWTGQFPVLMHLGGTRHHVMAVKDFLDETSYLVVWFCPHEIAFESDLDVIRMNKILNKFYEYQVKNNTFNVYTSFLYDSTKWPSFDPYETVLYLPYILLRKRIRTSFMKVRWIHAISILYTRKMLTTGGGVGITQSVASFVLRLAAHLCRIGSSLAGNIRTRLSVTG